MAVTENNFTGNGSTVLYSFTFPYIDETDVKVTLDGTLTTAYTFANATTLQFTTAPANGVAIRIYRDTNDDSLAATFFAGSAIRSQDLNNNFTQTLYVTQEINNAALRTDGTRSMAANLDLNGNKIINLAAPTAGGDATNKTYVDTQDALKVAKAGDTMTGNLAMSGNKVTGLGAPTAGTDAVTKTYVDGYINTAYLGPQASDPTTRPGGSPLQEGDLYFNTAQDILKAWTGTEWVISAAAGNIVRWRKTAAGGETTLSGNDDLGSTLGYVVGNEQVYLNGALQTRGIDYTAATGTSITITPALTAGDVVELHAVQGYVSATVTAGSIGTLQLADAGVTSAKIADDTIVNADVNSAAGIVATKLSFTQAGTGATARTIDSKLKDVVSVKDFGAVGDGVTDDTAAIQAAINAAINAGHKSVFIPVGDYVVSNTIYLNTSAGQSFLGAGLVGEDPLESKILFKPSTNTSVCFEIRGGSGNNTNKHITNLFIVPFDSSYNTKGVGVYIHGQCFTNLTNYKAQNLNYGLHLCNNDAGSFTEFTTLQNCRLVDCEQGIRIERKAGDYSFHGTRFHDVMINIKDGQYGLYITGTDGVVFLYNSYFDINFTCENSGTPVAIYAHNCNTQNNAGYIRSENPTYFQATSSGEFHMSGIGNSITNVNYVAGTPDGAFIFEDNRSGSAFVNANLSSYNPRPLPTSLAERNGNGDFPAIFRIQGTNYDSIGLATYSLANNSVYFGRVALNDTLEDFVPSVLIDTASGEKIRSYNTNFFLTDNTNTIDQLKLNGGRVGGNLGRSIDYSISANAGVAQSVTTIQNNDVDRASILYIRLVGSQYEARFQLAFNHDGLGGAGDVDTIATHKQFNNTSGGVSGLSFTVNSSGYLVVNITTDRAITAKIRELGYGTQLVS